MLPTVETILSKNTPPEVTGPGLQLEPVFPSNRQCTGTNDWFNRFHGVRLLGRLHFNLYTDVIKLPASLA